MMTLNFEIETLNIFFGIKLDGISLMGSFYITNIIKRELLYSLRFINDDALSIFN